MDDTWGVQPRQHNLLSPITEEGSRRILFGEKKEKAAEEGLNLPSSREMIDPRRDFDADGRVSEREHSNNPNMPGNYYDYDSDEGFEISEATPDDDTAALDAKIDKLKEEVVSDTSLESYLNQIV
jgi:hypothetical protein